MGVNRVIKITKQRLIEIIKEEVHKLNEGGEKTYKSLMDLEKGIKDLEKTFKRDARDMQRERAGKVKKHIEVIKKSWTAIWADFQGR
jgi:prefoldin subunit 5